MANTDSPFGLRPVMRMDGSPYNGGTLQCVIPSTDSTATFIGDAVKLHGSSVDGYPTVIQAAATDAIFGVVTSFEPDRTDLENKHRLADTERKCHVVVGRDVLFEIQEDSTGGALTADQVGQNADIEVGSGDTTYGISAMELDSSGAAASTAQLKIVGLVQREDNEIGVNAKWLVRINESELADSDGGL